MVFNRVPVQIIKRVALFFEEVIGLVHYFVVLERPAEFFASVVLHVRCAPETAILISMPGPVRRSTGFRLSERAIQGSG